MTLVPVPVPVRVPVQVTMAVALRSKSGTPALLRAPEPGVSRMSGERLRTRLLAGGSTAPASRPADSKGRKQRA